MPINAHHCNFIQSGQYQFKEGRNIISKEAELHNCVLCFQDSEGRSPLMLAAAGGHSEIIQKLLEAGKRNCCKRCIQKLHVLRLSRSCMLKNCRMKTLCSSWGVMALYQIKWHVYEK